MAEVAETGPDEAKEAVREAPVGGYKQSGMGREMGMHAVNLYTEIKNIYFSSE